MARGPAPRWGMSGTLHRSDARMTHRSSSFADRTKSFLLGALTMLLLLVVVLGVAPGLVPEALRPTDARLAAAAFTPADADSAGRDTVTLARGVPPDSQPLAPSMLGSGPDAPVDTSVGPMPVVPRGRMVIPVRGVQPSELVDTYTQARGAGRRHDAIDIIAPRGTPVVAVAAGAVIKLFESDAGGTTLYQLAPDGRTIYYYAHLDRYAAGMTEGRALKQGEVLGYVGDTGNSTPGNYHLHFAVSTTDDPTRYWDGTPQNPYPLLRNGVAMR